MAGKSDKLFLGKVYDLDRSTMEDDRVYYDPDDLTTHAVITGMTGSGKTGLGVIMLEEAALKGIPAIIVDPKGDLTNLLLHFPDLLPSDFKPWVDPDAARREGITLEEAAEKAASLWKNGLSSYGIEKPQLEALRDAVEYAVYTPGSDAGLPVSILASFSAPPLSWEDNKEILREEISSIVAAILSMVGIQGVDPIKSKEHILLSNIFEEAWREGNDLDMAALINQVQSPPFEKLGVFPLEQFYPEKERFTLAMMLNNLLAAPGFQTWLEGQPLDIGQILFTPDGKPRHSVFYLAHLNDAERMFFITLLYSGIESWMRTQKGSSSLRAMIYFDEVAGYLPPVANPPSKNIILRMLKQARAFGVGLMLATQNPVDLDYKALSNAGTWMIGKLQTDQDKARLLDGLEGAAPGVDRRAIDRMISLLDKRVFLLHNVHEDEPQVFHTRWAMNYLPGPITRTQLSALNALVDAKIPAYTPTPSDPQAESSQESGLALGQDGPPAVSRSISTHYLQANRGLSEVLKEAGGLLAGEASPQQIVYRPVLVAQARVAFLDRKYNLSQEKVYSVRIDEMRRKGLVRWEEYLTAPIELNLLTEKPLPDARFAPLDDLSIEDSQYVNSLEKDFEDWIYRTQTLRLRLNPALDVVAGPEVSDEAFQKMCEEAAQAKQAEEIEVVKNKFEQKLKTLETKLRKAETKLADDEQELNHRRMEEAGKGLENVIGLLGGRRRSVTTSLTKRRMTAKAKSDVEKSEQEFERVKETIADLEGEKQNEIDAVEARWSAVINQVVEEPLSPYKKNIFMELFGLIWLPEYAFDHGGDWVTVPGFDLT